MGEEGQMVSVGSGGWIAASGVAECWIRKARFENAWRFSSGDGFAGSLPAGIRAGKRGESLVFILDLDPKNGAGGDQTFTLQSSGDRHR